MRIEFWIATGIEKKLKIEADAKFYKNIYEKTSKAIINNFKTAINRIEVLDRDT